MIAVLILAVIFFVVFTIVWFVNWSVHIEMNKEQNLSYDYVTFDTFMREFEKYKDDPRLRIDSSYNSIFLDKSFMNYILYFHSDIVKINNKCMIFYPISYLRYKRWIKKITTTHGRVKGLWGGDENA